MAGAILTVLFYRTGHDLVAAGFLVFAIGEGTIMSSAANGSQFQRTVIWGRKRFVGDGLGFVATFAGWIWTLLKVDGPLIRGK